MLVVIRSYFTPKVTEVQLVVIATLLVLLVVANETVRSNWFDVLLRAPAAGLLLALPIVYSFYHAFSSKPKSSFGQFVMIVLAIGMTAWVAIDAGLYVIYHQAPGLLIVFPTFNIISAFLLLIRLGPLTEQIAIGDNTERLEIFGAIILAIVLFAAGYWYFELYWALVFSICLAAAEILDMIFAHIRKTRSI